MIKISKKATTIAIVNQKGGTGKTTTCENLGVGLAMEGKKVLMVDVDPKCRIRHLGSMCNNKYVFMYSVRKGASLC